MWELFFCVALSSQINIELFFQKKVPVPGKKVRQKQVRNITSWICDGKFGKSYEYSKAYILSFYKYKFF